MSEVVGEGILQIKVDDSAVGSGVQSAGAAAGGGYTKGFLGNLKGLAVGVAGVLAAREVLSFAKESVGEAREAQKVGAATEQIIKATGAAANLTSGQIGDLASSLSRKTAVDDEQIQAGANLLLTFKNVKREGEGLNDVFGRATAAGLDLAAAGFGSVEGNAKQLGKALNDPLKGITALGRAGVTFTADQKKQIEGYVESNDLLSAQKIILGEVEAQVGGTAAATATSGEKAAVAFGNIKESVGNVLLPILDHLADVLVENIAPAIENLLTKTDALNPVFYAFHAAVNAVRNALTGAGDSGSALGGVFSTISTALSTGFAQALPVVQELFAALGSAAQEVLPLMRDLFLNQVLPAITTLGTYVATNLFPIFLQLVGVIRDQIIPTFIQVATFIYGTVYPALLQIATTVATNLKPVLDQVVATVRDTLIPTFSQLVATFRDELLPALQPLIENLITIGGFVLDVASKIAGVLLPILLRFAGFILSNVVPAVASIIVGVTKFVTILSSLVIGIGRAIGSVGSFGSTLASIVSGGLKQVIDAVTELPGKITALGGKLLQAGKDIIGSFFEGLGSTGGAISGIADQVVNAVKSAINGLIDKLNGLLEFKIRIPGAPDINVNAPNIGHLQTGSRSTLAGDYIVGEVGPERVTLPAGARVATAAQTRQQAGGIDYAALGAAVAAALVPLIAAQRPISVQLPTGDPEAAALAVMNRLAVS